MGSPISGITAEIFLQHLEQSHVKLLLDSKHITFYSRNVDDILIIYDASRTNLDAITLRWPHTPQPAVQLHAVILQLNQLPGLINHQENPQIRI